MTRIVAGRWKGRVLRTPAGATTRPTGEKIRAALANSLQAGGFLEGAAVLDLYAGTGALGLELLSRGADSLVSVEQDRHALEALRANVATLDAAGSVSVLAAAVRSTDLAARLAGRRFDVVVADPPYEVSAEEIGEVLSALVPVLAGGADLVVERSRRGGEPVWGPPLQAVRTKRFGDTLLCYGRAP